MYAYTFQASCSYIKKSNNVLILLSLSFELPLAPLVFVPEFLEAAKTDFSAQFAHNCLCLVKLLDEIVDRYCRRGIDGKTFVLLASKSVMGSPHVDRYLSVTTHCEDLAIGEQLSGIGSSRGISRLDHMIHEKSV